MADKIEILVQLNDAEARQKIKALKDDLKQLEKGATIKITASAVETAQKNTNNLNKSLDEVQKTRSININQGALSTANQAANQAVQTLRELERPHNININASQLMGLPSAFQQSVRNFLNTEYTHFGKLVGSPYTPNIPAITTAARQLPAIVTQYGVPVGNPYGGGFVFSTQPDYGSVGTSGKYGYGGVMLPALRSVGELSIVTPTFRGYVPNFTLGGSSGGFILTGSGQPDYGMHNYGAGGFMAPAIRSMGGIVTVTGDFDQRMRAAINNTEKEWGGFTDMLHGPAFFNIPNKYIEKEGEELGNAFVRGMSKARVEAVSFSDVLTNIGGGLSTVGGALQNIGGLFNIDLAGTAVRTLTAYGTILATQGIGKGIARYDTLRTYPKYMELMGVSAEKAEASQEKINDAILGLPVGLDEASEEIRRYTMYLQGSGETMDETADKATDLAIGLEKALVAGGANTAKQTTARYEIDRLLATGSLANSRQWQALLNGLGISTQYLQEVMGYGDLSRQEFIAGLSANPDKADFSISGQEFIEGIAKLADYEPLDEAVAIYKETISAWLSRISFAMARGIERVLGGVNVALGGEEKGITGYLKDVRDGIDNLFLSIRDWVEANPDVINMFFEKFTDIMARAKELNIGQVARDLATEMGKMIDFFIKVYDLLPNDFWKDLFIFSQTWAGPLGRMFSLAGGLLSGLGRLSGLLGKLPLIGKLFNIFSLFTPKGITVNGVGGFKALAGGLGSVAAFGGIIIEYAKIIEVISNIELGPNLEKNLKIILPSVGLIGVLVASLSGAFSTLTGPQQLSFLAGEGLTLGLEGLIAGVGGILFEFAELSQKISDLSLGNFEENLGKIAELMKWVVLAVGGSTAIAGGIASIGGGVGFLFELAGLGITEGIIIQVAQVCDIVTQFADTAQKIADLSLPGNYDTKVRSLMGAVETIFRAFPKFENLDDTVRQSGQYKTLFKNIADSLTELKRAADGIEPLESSIAELNSEWVTVGGVDVKNADGGVMRSLVERIAEFAGGLGTIYDALNAEFGTGYLDKWGSSNYDDIIQNMGDALEKIKKVAINLNSIRNTFDTLNLGLSGSIVETAVDVGGGYKRIDKSYSDDPFQGLVGKINEMTTGVVEIMKAFGGETAIGSMFKDFKSTKQYNVITNMKGAITTIGEIASEISTLSGSLQGITYTSDYSNKSLLSVATEEILTVAQALYELFSSDTMIQIGGMENSYGTESIKTFFENIKAATDYNGLKGVLFNLSHIQDELDSLIKDNVPSHLKLLIIRLMEAFDLYTVEEGEDFIKKAVYIRKAFDNIVTMMDDLSTIKESMKSIAEGDVNIGDQVGSIITGLFNSFQTEDADGFSEKMSQMGDLLGALKETVTTLSQVSLADLNDQMRTLADYLNNWINPWLGDMVGHLNDVEDSARRAGTQIDYFKLSMAYCHSHFTTMYADLDNLVTHFNTANIAAQNLANMINAIPTNINVNTNFTAIRKDPLSMWNLYKGGPVYRAFGGPIGTDTVPAWLTPGEFVMRTQAVKTFGEQFMANINALNIPGALNALVRHYTVPQNAHVNNISNRDNHAVVNQYITTDNPNYSYARASKYVRAL